MKNQTLSRLKFLFVVTIFLLSFCSGAWAEVGVPRWRCFPVEQLSPAKRARAEKILLNLCDREGLYTLVGGIKPMSSGWVSKVFDTQSPNLAELDELREILNHIRCGDEIVSYLTHHKAVHDGKRYYQAAVFNRNVLGKQLQEQGAFWKSWGFSSRTEPVEVLLGVEYAQPDERARGYGYLFGYPKHAVDFFVEAQRQQRTDPENKFVQRDFFHIPTFERETNRFVYAVPKGYQATEIDKDLRERSLKVLAEYRKRRAAYIGPGKPGIARLLRDWFDNGEGRCSPQFAQY